MENILGYLQVAGFIVLGGLAIYFKGNEKLRSLVSHYINEAEEEYKDLTEAGGKKFQYVVDTLYSLVWLPLRVIVTKERIGHVVQETFYLMESYVKKQFDKKVGE